MTDQKHIHVIGPSSHVEASAIEKAIEWLETQNYRVSIADQVYKKHYQSAGTINDKITALHKAYSNPDIDIIMTSCGGNGAIHLLDHIDFDLIKKNPKPMIGFSDITILLNAINKKTGQITYHGPTLTQLQKPIPTEQSQQLLSVINDNPLSLTWDECTILKDGTAQGRLIGGNLSVFQTLLGTEYLHDISKPYILLLEDVGDELSRYDRMLAHLRQAGLLKNASAILFGNFHSAQATGRVPFGKEMKEIITDLTSDLDIPIIMDCPFGHRGQLWTLPIGLNVNLNAHNQVYLTANC